MKKLLLLISLLLATLLGCGSSENEIAIAVEKYNENFLSGFDEIKALKEGCWRSYENVRAAYKDGKLDPLQDTLEKEHEVWLQTKLCIDDFEVQENETILYNVDASPSLYDWMPNVILFSVDKDNDSRGCFRFLQIKPVTWTTKVEIEVIKPYGSFSGSGRYLSCQSWYENGANLAYWDEDKTVGIREFDKPNYEVNVGRYLDRETLIYYHYKAPNYTFEEVKKTKDQFRIVPDHEFRKLFKKQLMDFYLAAVKTLELQESRESETKSKRKL